MLILKLSALLKKKFAQISGSGLCQSHGLYYQPVFSVNVDNALEIRKSKVERREVLECFSSGKLGPRTHFSTTRHQGKLNMVCCIYAP